MSEARIIQENNKQTRFNNPKTYHRTTGTIRDGNFDFAFQGFRLKAGFDGSAVFKRFPVLVTRDVFLTAYILDRDSASIINRPAPLSINSSDIEIYDGVIQTDEFASTYLSSTSGNAQIDHDAKRSMYVERLENHTLELDDLILTPDKELWFVVNKPTSGGDGYLRVAFNWNELIYTTA